MIIKENEPMSRHTTFAVGGPARYYLVPESFGEVRSALDFADDRRMERYVVGRGSNLLFSDREYKGVVIEIGSGLKNISYSDDGTVTAEAGVPLSTLAKSAANKELTGLEFAGGIPGTVGGAVVMNAGAYDGEIQDTLVSIEAMSSDGEIKTYTADELKLSYRYSVLQERDDIVLSAKFQLNPGNKEDIEAKMKDFATRRRDKQPLNLPSAGSTFKRPEGFFAGKLIEDAGLKGYRIGDAAVSEKHAGFVVNLGDATASEIHSLITHIQNKVESEFGVRLEPEVRMVGDFSWDLDVF